MAYYRKKPVIIEAFRFGFDAAPTWWLQARMTQAFRQGDGVYMKRAHDGQLTPAQLNTALNWTCGTAPTVVMVSACYSGQFIQPLRADNRIIMTAASATRPSFGCSEAQEYTFWDGCVIDHFARSTTWENLYDHVKK